MALLDTTVLIDLARKPGSPAHKRIVHHLAALAALGHSFFTSRINEAELRVGPERATSRAAELAKVEQVLANVTILEFDQAAAWRYAVLKARLLDLGRPAGDCDTMIAAVALANAQSVVTSNLRHFADMSGLVVEPY